ncbi:MAG: leucine-rich repeat domain-containing protein [Lachnospiraceae bacterium]|nr:leucine-rich repeat domain-containing protein [Lachnospiraceae bacterium]
MRRFTSILCVLALLIGMLSGAHFAPTVEAYAEDEVPGKVTVVAFSDPTEASEWNNLADIVVTTGAAVSVGGISQWNHGVVIIEPQNGWAVTEACYFENNNANSLTVEKLNNVITSLESNTNGNIPDDVTALFNSYTSEEKAQLDAVYINRALYNKIKYNDICVSFEKNGQVIDLSVYVETDDIFDSDGITLNVGDTINVFDNSKVKADIFVNGYTKSDYSIDHYGIDATPSNALSAQYESESDENYGEFKATINGLNSIVFANKKNGLHYEYFVYMLDDSMPLKKSDFALAEDVNVQNDTGNTDSGKYSLYPINKAFFSELSISFTLPNDCSIAEIRYNGTELEESVKKNLTMSEEEYEFPVTAKLSKEGSKYTIELVSEQEKVALRGFLRIIITCKGSNYVYNFSIRNNRDIMMGGQGRQLLSVAIGSTLRLMDFISLRDPDEQQDLFDGITDGIYEVHMQGVKPEFENGEFKGNLKVYYPCSRMYLWDTQCSSVLYSGDADIRTKVSTLIESGSSLDLSSLLNGYWSDSVSVDDRSSAGYDLTEKLFTAPASVQDMAEFIVTVGLAEIKIKVCPAGSLMDSLTDVANTVGTDESLVVDIDAEDVTLSKDTLNNFKDHGGDNSSIVLKNNKNAHKPEWHFNKNDLTNAAEKDVKLDVAVGDELQNTSIDNALKDNNISGLKLGFASNGVLPGRTAVRFYITALELALFASPNSIQLYYYDVASGKLVREGTNLYVSRDIYGAYYIEVVVTHNSDFVLSSTDQASFDVSGGETGESGTGGESGSTGGSTDSSETGTAGGTDNGNNSGSTGGPSYIVDNPTSETDKTENKPAEDETTVIKNDDGSVTKSTVTENKDGSKTIVEETAYKDGTTEVTETVQKSNGTEVSKTTVTDSEGEVVSETVREESVSKKGTKIEETETVYADGSSEYDLIKTAKNGTVFETNAVLDAEGAGTISWEKTNKSGKTISKEYSVAENGEVKILSYKTDGIEAKIPSVVEVDGAAKAVTAITKNLFAGNQKIRKVTIGQNITTIGKGAFKNASSLKSIIIYADNITKISKDAFSGIAENAVIKIEASKEQYEKIIKLIKKSGIDDSVKFKRIK